MTISLASNNHGSFKAPSSREMMVLFNFVLKFQRNNFMKQNIVRSPVALLASSNSLMLCLLFVIVC
eukprot:c613_g1_i1 orf=1-195(-)